MKPKYYFEIALQNGDLIYSSKEQDELFDSEEQAEEACSKKLDEIIQSQDCDEEEKFTVGDFRTHVLDLDALAI